MKKVLLISRDLNYIWALKKNLSKIPAELDYVFTVSEANVRLEKFNYDLIILDNLRDFEFNLLKKAKILNGPVLTIDMENFNYENLKKENSSSSVLSYIRENLNL